MSEPKLPPGWTWEPHGTSVLAIGPTINGVEYSAAGKTPEEKAANAWGTWRVMSGITREKWEAMERACEFVRDISSELSPEGLFHGLERLGEHDVQPIIEEADAILEALGDDK